MDIEFGPANMANSGAAVYCIADVSDLSAPLQKLDEQSNKAVSNAIRVNRYNADEGKTLELAGLASSTLDRVLLAGFKDSGERTMPQDMKLGAVIYKSLEKSGSRDAVIHCGTGVDAAAVAYGFLLRSYRFDKYRTRESDDKKPSIKKAVFAVDDPDAVSGAFDTHRAVAAGVFLARDLTSEPPNILHPVSFAEQVRNLAADGIDVEILGEAEMKKLGMGSLLSVGEGSQHESQLAIMVWNGADKAQDPVAFIGKGVTFDTGGISLKPAEAMMTMKQDMGGAGIVVGAMKALARRKAKVNAVGIVGLVENMPAHNATRPGDIVTSMSGQTIEILNTDAEGRLVLADALWYCQDRFKPRLMVDFATLTGAMIISLGEEYAGFFSDDDDLSDALARAGAITGDKVWRMPLHESYDRQLDTPVADMKNIGGKSAGSITAAQFLHRFTNKVPWAHVDVAGVVWSDKDLPLAEKGATGYGVQLVDAFVRDYCES